MIWSKPTLRGRDEGAVAVETAVTLSVLLLLLLGIIEFTVAFYQLNTMQLAVSQAGRCAMINNSAASNLLYCVNTQLACSSPQNCAEKAMQAILPSAAVCTTPTAEETCVTASLKTNDGTNGMTLTASYGFTFIALTGPLTISSATWVPLN